SRRSLMPWNFEAGRIVRVAGQGAARRVYVSAVERADAEFHVGTAGAAERFHILPVGADFKQRLTRGDVKPPFTVERNPVGILLRQGGEAFARRLRAVGHSEARDRALSPREDVKLTVRAEGKPVRLYERRLRDSSLHPLQSHTVNVPAALIRVVDGAVPAERDAVDAGFSRGQFSDFGRVVKCYLEHHLRRPRARINHLAPGVERDAEGVPRHLRPVVVRDPVIRRTDTPQVRGVVSAGWGAGEALALADHDHFGPT